MRKYGLLLYCSLLFFGIYACKEGSSGSSKEKPGLQAEIPVLETGGEEKMPGEWIDKNTGHKIMRLSPGEDDNRSFYFHNNPFLPTEDGEGWLMVFYRNTPSGKQLFSVNLTTGKIRQITDVAGDKKGEILAEKTRKLYYMSGDSVFSTHVDTRETKLVYTFKDQVGGITSVNADETLLGGVLSSPEEKAIFEANPAKGDYFNKIYEAKLERKLITIDIETGKLKVIHAEHAWLNHVQFSPVDPDRLMYCHEGPWHKVDRIWNIDINSGKTELLHKRTVEREIAGHEFFSRDGKTIWFDLQVPRGETFYLAGKDLETGKETRYALNRNEWSIHYNIAPDQKSFAGDGGDPGQVAKAEDGMWIYHLVPDGDRFVSEKLVDMKHHNYKLEPNVHFSPDGKWIIFRANFEGSSQIYAVALEKTPLTETS